ncbi:hypothetical protein T06_15367 [Trichinella sp. T6]|nr:hypothetical protein T06_15367 [Trichinella sp. T6]
MVMSTIVEIIALHLLVLLSRNSLNKIGSKLIVNMVLAILLTYQSTAALLSSLQVATCAVQLLDKTKMTIVSVTFIAMNFEQWLLS